MPLPTFLGIGAPRCGTTWLHGLLAAHPDVCVPTRRKEVGYLDRHFDRGPDWYAAFFERAATAVGEITPEYLFCPEAPARAAALGSVERLLLILREPVARTHSVYGMLVRDGRVRGAFEDFLAAHPDVVARSAYADHVARWLEPFDRSQLLVLLHERAVADVPATLARLADHLGIPPFPDRSALSERGPVNASYVPRWPRAHAFAVGVGHRLRDAGLDRVVNAAARLGARRLFGRKGALPPIAEPTRAALADRYRDDNDRLAALLDLDLSIWG